MIGGGGGVTVIASYGGYKGVNLKGYKLHSDWGVRGNLTYIYLDIIGGGSLDKLSDQVAILITWREVKSVSRCFLKEWLMCRLKLIIMSLKVIVTCN